MRVLVGCERSGVIRRAFRALGHDAWSCDLEPAEDGSPYHLRGDCLWFAENDEPWDLFIVHPPCQFLSVSGLHWNQRRPERHGDTERAIAFASQCLCAAVPRVCMENPVGILSTRLRKPEQIIQPYLFGDDASKKTCLWLNNLPPLEFEPAQLVQPRWVRSASGRNLPRWANQTDSGQNRLGPSPTRAADRARTYPGIAAAMAAQWGRLPPLTMAEAYPLDLSLVA